MTLSQHDVAIVGAGCAGLTAAVALARAGFNVAVIEAGASPGAQGGSGGVYFAESLAQPDALGPDGVEALPWERRLVQRGLFATDGHGLLGATYRDPDAFRHCYTALGPVFASRLGEVARGLGARLLTDTTAESLIRDGGRVIGVATQRGPVYADLVFLAEGDAANLVAREHFDRSTDPRDAPRFLLALGEVLELPAGLIEERFGVGAGQGVAHEVLLRNGTLGGRPLHLNARGFVCTNRESLSVGVVVPVEHLRHFGGEPGLVLEWFQKLPALGPWWDGARRGGFTAKLLRGGGVRDMPYLIDDGLAVGGAAAGLGVSFPVHNHTGPAAATGLLLARAVRRIRAGGGDFTRESLRQHYLGPLQETRYWQDAEFLRRWPGYVRKTRVLFDRTLDLALGSAHVWARPRRRLPGKVLDWLRLLHHLAGPVPWGELRGDLKRLGWALRLRQVVARPLPGRLLLDGTLNAFRDLLRQPRANVPAAGTLRLHYRVAGEDTGAPPVLLRRWFGRFGPVLAAAAGEVCRNDDVPLSARLSGVVRLLLRQVNILDLLAGAGAGLMTAVAGLVLAGWDGLRRRLGRRRERVLPRAYHPYAAAAQSAADLAAARAARTGGPVPAPGRGAFIRLLWPWSLPDKNAIAGEGLEHVCPAGVFATHAGPLGQVWAEVRPERCVLCEACWRASTLVDWARDTRPLLPHPTDPWAAAVADLARGLSAEAEDLRKRPGGANYARVLGLLDRVGHKLAEFDDALARPPATVDRTRGEYLEMLARYAQQVSVELVEALRGSDWAENWSPGVAEVGRFMLGLATGLRDKAEERTRRTWDGRFAWAAADGRQMRQHHLAGLRRLFGVVARAVGWEEDVLSRKRQSAAACGELLAGMADELCRRAVAHATTCVQYPGLFRDEEGRDAIGKFGAVKRRVADIAARRYLLETLADALSAEGAGAGLLKAVAAEAIGEVAYDVGQLVGLVGVLEDPSLAGLVRDAAAWRFRGAPGSEAYRAYGEQLLAEVGAGAVVEAGGDFEEVRQRQALRAELEAVRRLEERRRELAGEWRQRPRPAGEGLGPAEAEVAEGLGQQGAYLLAAKALLLRTHARLEQGRDAELEVLLLRAWLDDADVGLDEFTGRVRRRLYPPGVEGDRPLVEPGAGPPVSRVEEFLTAGGPYESGDFLVTPVDLLRPRLVPEMAATDSAGVVPLLAGERTGRLMAATEQMRERAGQARSLPRAGGSPAVAWRLERMEEDLFIAEALAFDVAGLRAQPQTRSVRLESLGARILVTDLRHRVFETFGEVRGLAGAGAGGPRQEIPDDLGAHLDEGHGARKRFFLLRELAAEVLPRWARVGAAAPRHLGREVLEQELLKRAFRERLEAAHGLLGKGLWQNPNLQANCLALADLAAWLKAADSTLGRVAWLARTFEGDEPDARREVGARALARCHAEVRDLLRRFDEDLADLRRGYYAPQVRAASLLFERLSGQETTTANRSGGSTPAGLPGR